MKRGLYLRVLLLYFYTFTCIVWHQKLSSMMNRRTTACYTHLFFSFGDCAVARRFIATQKIEPSVDVSGCKEDADRERWPHKFSRNVEGCQSWCEGFRRWMSWWSAVSCRYNYSTSRATYMSSTMLCNQVSRRLIDRDHNGLPRHCSCWAIFYLIFLCDYCTRLNFFRIPRPLKFSLTHPTSTMSWISGMFAAHRTWTRLNFNETLM
jgi:hypothetical protein